MVSNNSINNTVQDNDFSVNRATAGTTVQSSVNHSDDTSATSNAKFLSAVGGTAGGDPHINFNVSGTQDYSFGIDNSDSDNMKITDGADPSSGNTYTTFDQATQNVWFSGISFDGGTNVLDFYEEGVWTPNLHFGGATTGISYNSQSGNYTRIGRVVFYSFFMNLMSKGTATGEASVRSLPYTSISDSFDIGAGTWTLLTLTGARTYVACRVNASSTLIELVQTGSGLATSFITDTNFSNNSTLRCTGFYFAS